MSEAPPRDVNAYAEAYTGQAGFEGELVRIRRQHVLASMKDYPTKRVLEVGCGLEPLFRYYQGFDSHVTVEPAKLFFEHAKEEAARVPNVRVLQKTIEDAATELSSEGFDFVLLSGMLHEVPDPEKVLRGVLSLSGPKTVVHVNVPNARSFHRLLALEMGLIPDVFQTSPLGASLQRSREYDRSRLEGEVTASGFRVVRFRTYAMKPFTHRQMELLTGAEWCPNGLVDGLDRMVKYAPDLGSEMSIEMVRADG